MISAVRIPQHFDTRHFLNNPLPVPQFHDFHPQLTLVDNLAEDDPHLPMYSYTGDNDPPRIRVTEPDHACTPKPEVEPLPLRLARKYGFGYRRHVPPMVPHWSHWPVTRPHTTTGVRKSHQQETGSADCCVSGIHHWNTSADAQQPHREGNNYDSSSMQKEDRAVVMNRGLSPRRAPPPVMPGRSLSQTGNCNNSSNNRFLPGSLDLHASPYNANRGFSQGFTAYSIRESRPKYRHISSSSRRGDDYVHDQSIFFTTSPMVTGYFIIHPDWVSERTSLRRSKSLLSF